MTSFPLHQGHELALSLFRSSPWIAFKPGIFKSVADPGDGMPLPLCGPKKEKRERDIKRREKEEKGEKDKRLKQFNGI